MSHVTLFLLSNLAGRGMPNKAAAKKWSMLLSLQQRCQQQHTILATAAIRSDCFKTKRKGNRDGEEKGVRNQGEEG